MRVSTGSPAIRVWLVSLLALVALICHSDTAVNAQSPGQRWDGLIEDLTASNGYFAPSQPSNGPSRMSRHAVSADGRYVLFNSDATNLGYSTPALYMRDRHAFQTQVLLGGPALAAVISADGTQIAFQICDPYGHPEGPREICDVYTLNLQTWDWRNASSLPDGTFGDGDSAEPMLSSNGRFVAFRTKAANLVAPGGAPGAYQVVLRDRDADGNGIFDEPGTAVLETISVSPAGAAGDAPSETAEVSDDGRFVAFRSAASNLVPGDTNGVWDVFLRDRQSGQTRRINVRPEGQESTASVDSPAISMTPNGSAVAFTSADGLLAGSTIDDMNNVADVYIYQTSTGVLTRIDLGWGPPIAGGYIPGNGATDWPMLSADGRYVTMQSAATNVEVPPMSGSTGVYVFDRTLQKATRVSIRPDGTEPDHDCVTPQISADGSMVVFISAAMNLGGDITSDVDRIYGAVHFDVTPAAVTVGGGAGGTASFTVTTQQHTNWWATWDWSSYWFMNAAPPLGIGDGTLTFSAGSDNPDPTPRSVTVQVLSKSVVFTQSAGLSVASVSPAVGPETGGTHVTLIGTGFEPGMRVVFDGVNAATEFVSSTMLVATTPAHERGTVWVAVFPADNSRAGWIPDAFRFTDTTPPDLVWPYFSGIEGSNGWFLGDVTLNWAMWDQQSPITATTGCNTTIVTADTNGTTFTCAATSEGGTTSVSTVVKRDATPPSIAITSPSAAVLYERGSLLTTAFTCSDAGSGVETCGFVPPGAPVDTSYSGWQTTWVTACDVAGNFGTASAEYAVSTGVCTQRPPGMRLWFPFEGRTQEVIHGSPFAAQNPSWAAPIYVEGEVGQAFSLPGWQFVEFSHQLDDVHFVGQMTFAAWVKADGQVGEAGTIASKEDQFRIARFPDGTLRWAFSNSATGFVWVNTGATIPAGVWTHVAVTYDHGVVSTYLNGRLAHTYSGTGDMTFVAGLPYWGQYLSFGNREDPAHASFLIGAIDEVQMLDTVWNASAVESAFLAGAHGTCPPTATVVLVTEGTASYGDSTFVVRAQLRQATSQQPIADEPVRLVSRVSPGGAIAGTVTLTTDADGWVQWDAPIAAGAVPNVYPTGVRAYFDADSVFGGSSGIGQVSIQSATPVITWPEPAAIVYGTPLGGAQLNATSSVAGAFTYAPAVGAVLNAGTGQALSATFTPADTANYSGASVTTTIDVGKAAPTVTVTGGSVTYDGASHVATGSVTGIGGVTLGPLTFTYNGASSAPVNAGTYAVIGTFAGDANYAPASAPATLTIAKAAAVLAWTRPGAIPYGAPLGAQQLSATASIPGSFTFTPALGAVLGAGAARPLSATFVPADPSNYNGGVVATTIDVMPVPLSIRANNATKPFGAPMPPFTAVFVGLVNGDTPASFGGVLGFTTTATAASAVGTYPIVPGGLSSPNYSVTFVPGTLTIVRAPVIVSVTSQPEPSGFDQPMTFTVAVATVVPGAGVPTGTVRFVDGPALLGSATLANGAAALTTAGLAVGSRVIEARYDGDSSFEIGIGSATHVINDASSTPSVSVTTSRSPANAGASVTFTATVTLASGSISGIVSFHDGSVQMGSGTLSAGRATFATSALAVGSHAITARYAGAGGVPPSRSAVLVQTIVGTGTTKSTTTALTASPNPSALGGAVTFTATVTGTSAKPTGRVLFMVDGVVVGNPSGELLTPSSGATARVTLPLTTLAHGKHKVSATYLGDSVYRGSTASVTQTVN